MEQKGYIKHVFPGGNTTQGFYSFYDNILFQNEATRIIVIKGGPGVGKSSFMKKIGQHMVDLGYDVEYHHCSSDPNSLDGIVIPAIKVGFIDGTAPHVVDPKNPGAVDEILHLGDFWNEHGLRANKDNIQKISSEVSRFFQKGYAYLKAAAPIYENWAVTQGKAFDVGKLNLKTDDLICTLFKDHIVSSVLGKERHLFGTAITPEGFMDFLHTIIGSSKTVYMIKDAPGASAGPLMNKLYKTAVERGLDVECYHSPILPEKIEDILVPSLDLAITVSNDYHKAKVLPTNIVDLTSYLDSKLIQSIQMELECDKRIFDELVSKAVYYIQKAKRLHDDLESYYVTNMDFEQIDAVLEHTIERVLEYASEYK